MENDGLSSKGWWMAAVPICSKSVVLRKVANLYRSGKFSDVTFIVENTVFKLHKNILANSCPYFEAMLFGRTNEANSETITLRKTSKKLFEKVLEFIYLDICATKSLSVDEFIDLMCLAHEYQFQELFDALVAKIKFTKPSKISLIVSVFNLPFIEEFEELKSKCVQFFLKHSELFVDNMDIFAKFSLKALHELVTKDEFYADEIDIFSCLQKWREINQVTGKEVFSLLRLNLIKPKDYIEFVKPFDLIDSDQYVTALATNEYSARKFLFRDDCEGDCPDCEGEIDEVSMFRSDGSHEKDEDDFPLSLAPGDTIVVKLNQVSCTMNCMSLKFEGERLLNYTFGVKIYGNEMKEVIANTSSKSGQFVAHFSDRIVDKIKITYFGGRNKSGTLSNSDLDVDSLFVGQSRNMY